MSDKEPRSKSFRGTISENKVLKIKDREGMNQFLDTLSGEVDITISEIASRSHYQNKYYWGVVINTLLQDESFGGYSKYELHDAIKEHLKVGSTSKMSVYEFHEFLDNVIRWAATDWSVRIPDPDEDLF